MPGLDLAQVSSNWKKLNEKIQAEKKGQPQNDGLKRKRLVENATSARKKTRVDGIRSVETTKKHKMGLGGSKVEANKAGIDQRQSNLAREHGISQEDISAAYGTPEDLRRNHVDDVNGGLHTTHKAGRYLALDCEMVGTGPPPYLDHVLARVSLVNFHGEQIYDSYVLPPPGIVVEDYRTFVSGIKKSDLVAGYARPSTEVQKDVASLLQGRILVGHALKNDLQVLLLPHPKRDLRDTSRHPKFRLQSNGKPPALRRLAKTELGMEIQSGEHSSIEDARAAMMLFRKDKAGFEEENVKKFGQPSRAGRKGSQKTVANGIANGDSNVDDDEESDQEVDGSEEDVETGGNASISTAKKKRKKKKKKRTKRK